MMAPDYLNVATETQNEVLMDKAVSYMYVTVSDEVQQFLDSAGPWSIKEHCTDHYRFEFRCRMCHKEVYSSASHKIIVVISGVQK